MGETTSNGNRYHWEFSIYRSDFSITIIDRTKPANENIIACCDDPDIADKFVNALKGNKEK